MSILALPDFLLSPRFLLERRWSPLRGIWASMEGTGAGASGWPQKYRCTHRWSPFFAVLFCAVMVGQFAVGQDKSSPGQSGATSGIYKAVQQPDRVDFLREGKLITSYHFRSGSKPVLWPIHAGDGHRMTRSYPLDATIPGEAHDHPHHRGLWMTFGDVNGLDWWAEGEGKGLVVHTKVLEVSESGKSASMIAEHDWMTPAKDGQTSVGVLRETCRYVIHGNAQETVIDCEYLLRGVDTTKPVVFGDTKEGMFAVRVPESMPRSLRCSATLKPRG